MQFKNFLIERYYGEYEFSTEYMLSSSDCETLSIAELLAIDGSYADNLNELLQSDLGYTESQGDPTLRESISKLYENVEMENILVYTGAEEGIFGFISSCVDNDDHIIAMFPAYQSLYQVAKNKGVEVSFWQLNEDKGWSPSFEVLTQLVKPNTKALVINTPHIPTGFHFSATEQEEIIKFCQEYDLLLFSDEVYRLGEYQIEDRLPPASDLYDKALSLGVLSKPLGLPGLRIGWIACQNKVLLQRLQAFKDYTTICNSGPSEFLSNLAIANYQKLIDRNLAIIKTNLKLLFAFMERYDQLFSWIPPKAANICFVRILFSMTADEFCKQLREEKGVLLLPSTTYEYGNQHFRIGFGRKNFPEALDLLKEFVIEHLL